MWPPVGHVAVGMGMMLLAYLIPLAVGGYNDMLRDGEASRIEAALSKQAREFDQKVTDIREEARQRFTEREETLTAENERHLERINELSRTLDERLSQDPLAVDVSLYRELYRVMCEIQAIGSENPRQACDIPALEADPTGYSPVVSITSETIEFWAAACEHTGSEDVCNPRTIGLRPEAAMELLGWLENTKRFALQQDNNYDTVVRQIEEIRNIPEPTIGEN